MKITQRKALSLVAGAPALLSRTSFALGSLGLTDLTQPRQPPRILISPSLTARSRVRASRFAPGTFPSGTATQNSPSGRIGDHNRRFTAEIGKAGRHQTSGDHEPHFAKKVENVELLGFKGKVKWTQDEQGLTVFMPEEKPCDHAITVKIV